MSKPIKIKKGLDVPIKGKAEKIFIKAEPAEYYAVKPIDFKGLIPKLTVKQDDAVKAGTTLFFDKYKPEICYTSPVSGTVEVINRGERRKILEVIIKKDNQQEYLDFKKEDPLSLSREEIKNKILSSGLWPSFIQRPYGIVANPNDVPKCIVISAFDTNPLAPDFDFIVKGCDTEFQTGIYALNQLAAGKIHVNVNVKYPPSEVFMKAKGVQINSFLGPHPSGNPGIQIHYIDPINKGDLIWVISPQQVISIGRLFLSGHYDASKVIALAGSEVIKPRYYKIISGASIKNIITDNVQSGNPRYISGNILTGKQIPADGFVGYYDSLVSVLPEGDQFEFLGWAMPGFNKYSTSRSFFSWMSSGKEYTLNTNLNGGERAFVVTGQYEKVVPMDIYPVQLLKAILVEDIDLMEKLGIYEVVEEDFALCEFVCTSKINVQEILRKGLDLMIKELG